ncbi:MAG: hypothetical protein P4M11_14360 [Candidatus Pacebacteria bacterium]|nr:hypothetical protein [Candidatus Paceibacterota bacterium]
MANAPVDINAVATMTCLDSHHTTLARMRAQPADDPDVRTLLAEVQRQVTTHMQDRESPHMLQGGRSLKRDMAIFVDSHRMLLAHRL